MEQQVLDFNKTSAVFSPDRKYRYSLLRAWGEGTRVCFCMLNPSTADEVQNDPTIRRCIGYAKAWGHAELEIVNLFALRSTDPNRLRLENDPIGSDNDDYISQAFINCEEFVCAWGTWGELMERGRKVYDDLYGHGRPLNCLKISKDGHPCHPLYLKADLKPFEFKM